jgi:hypothetical protein
MSTVRKARRGEEALGVISTRPGILLGGNTKNGVPVAFSGRVPVLVTNENGPVKQGDYLTVSASKEGYAMKAVESSYTIGRAISDTTDVPTSSVLMVVENKNIDIKILSIAGLAAVATSPDTFAKATTTVYQTLTDRLSHGTAVVTEYLSVRAKAVVGYFDKLFAKEIYADKVCIKKSDGQDVCITGDQVQSMLQGAQVSPSTNQPTVVEQNNVQPPSDTSTSTSQTSEVATTTDSSSITVASTTTPTDTATFASSTPEIVTTSSTSTSVIPESPSDTSTSTTVSLITDTPEAPSADSPTTQ